MGGINLSTGLNECETFSLQSKDQGLRGELRVENGQDEGCSPSVLPVFTVSSVSVQHPTPGAARDFELTMGTRDEEDVRTSVMWDLNGAAKGPGQQPECFRPW